jgi:hypothetical protein
MCAIIDRDAASTDVNHEGGFAAFTVTAALAQRARRVAGSA